MLQCSEQGVRLDVLQRCCRTSTILWFCGIDTHIQILPASKMLIFSSHVNLKMLEGYSSLCFQLVVPGTLSPPSLLRNQLVWMGCRLCHIAHVSHGLPHVWTSLYESSVFSGHPGPAGVGTKHVSRSCHFQYLKEMAVDNADVVLNYELAKMYAVIFCDCKVIPSLSLRHLMK